MNDDDKVRRAVREMCDREHPGWQWATVVVCPAAGKPAETLVIEPGPSSSSGSASARP